MATKQDVDLKLNTTAGYYDISIGSNGDFELTDALDTSLIVTFFTDARADISEVQEPQFQRGWWGNLFSDRTNFEIGSKIWLLDQAVNNQLTLNNAIDYGRKGFEWVLRFNYADNVIVRGNQSLSSLSVIVQIIKNNNVVLEKVFDLWQNTFNLAAQNTRQ